jgi:aldehyde dehydrogenase
MSALGSLPRAGRENTAGREHAAGREQLVAEIAREVVARLSAQLAAAPRNVPSAEAPRTPAPRPGNGVFATVDEAVSAAARAQVRVAALGLEERGRIVATIRRLCEEHKRELAERELAETGIGRLDHKIEKLESVRRVLGVEALRIDARSDSTGLCVIERAPWGVIGMVLPATHSAPTLASNAINVISAGNAAVFSRTPRRGRWPPTPSSSSTGRSSGRRASPTPSPRSSSPPSSRPRPSSSTQASPSSA